MARCGVCGKQGKTGRQVSHSGRRSSRRFSPNIQKTTVWVGGLRLRLKLCSRCLKKLKKGKKSDDSHLSSPRPQAKVKKNQAVDKKD